MIARDCQEECITQECNKQRNNTRDWQYKASVLKIPPRMEAAQKDRAYSLGISGEEEYCVHVFWKLIARGPGSRS